MDPSDTLGRLRNSVSLYFLGYVVPPSSAHSLLLEALVDWFLNLLKRARLLWTPHIMEKQITLASSVCRRSVLDVWAVEPVVSALEEIKGLHRPCISYQLVAIKHCIPDLPSESAREASWSQNTCYGRQRNNTYIWIYRCGWEAMDFSVAKIMNDKWLKNLLDLALQSFICCEAITRGPVYQEKLSDYIFLLFVEWLLCLAKAHVWNNSQVFGRGGHAPSFGLMDPSFGLMDPSFGLMDSFSRLCHPTLTLVWCWSRIVLSRRNLRSPNNTFILSRRKKNATL